MKNPITKFGKKYPVTLTVIKAFIVNFIVLAFFAAMIVCGFDCAIWFFSAITIISIIFLLYLAYRYDVNHPD